ncbi:MAG: hypothetical protein UDG94_05280 [Peptococcaceae bacterium]|nr:hypothetical protein [Peptococcaceae bacterium]
MVLCHQSTFFLAGFAFCSVLLAVNDASVVEDRWTGCPTCVSCHLRQAG